MPIFKRKGQLSLEFILLIFGVILAGAIVTLELSEKNPKFLGNDSSNIKKETLGLFSSGNTGSNELSITETFSINTGQNTSTNSSSNNNENNTNENTTTHPHSHYSTSQQKGDIDYIDVRVCGKGFFGIYNDNANYTKLNNSCCFKITNQYYYIYSVNGHIDTVCGKIGGKWGGGLLLHNVKCIRTLKVKVTKRGFVNIHNVSINSAYILNRGKAFNVYIENCHINSLTINHCGAWKGVIIVNSNISQFNPTVKKGSILVENSYINGKYVGYMNITK